MSLNRVAIQNFQSLRDISLDLSRFTVIVGPSSSGKSAFVRALRTLANNRRGLDFLTHGERVCTITATTERGTVVLNRSKSNDENYYELIPTGDPTAQQKFSKLGGITPPEVSTFLGIPQGNQSFAGQHDMPYLLADSASANASTLGRLTNVSVIFDAAREAKRQALDASKTVRLRSEDLAAAEATLERFEHLDEQQHALSRAEEKISAAYTAARTIERITSARDSLIAAATAVRTLTTAAEAPIPDLSPVLDVQQRLSSLLAARDALISAAESHRAALTVMAGLDTQQQALDEDKAALRANTENIFRERFLADDPAAEDGDHTIIKVTRAAAIAAQTVEDMNA